MIVLDLLFQRRKKETFSMYIYTHTHTHTGKYVYTYIKQPQKTINPEKRILLLELIFPV